MCLLQDTKSANKSCYIIAHVKIDKMDHYNYFIYEAMVATSPRLFAAFAHLSRVFLSATRNSLVITIIRYDDVIVRADYCILSPMCLLII